jgi:hypothetical protein
VTRSGERGSAGISVNGDRHGTIANREEQHDASDCADSHGGRSNGQRSLLMTRAEIDEGVVLVIDAGCLGMVDVDCQLRAGGQEREGDEKQQERDPPTAQEAGALLRLACAHDGAGTIV